tara:strand:+ start:9705 stop:9845 length:141 start_codon:yes stop_codon:yes gene_type:complete
MFDEEENEIEQSCYMNGGGGVVTYFELRQDGGNELMEDGFNELREY